MKKMRLTLLSIFVLLFGGLLTACSIGNLQVDFSQSELVISAGQEINLGEYIKTEGVSARDVELKAEDSSIVSISNKTASTLKSGQSKVFAVYKGNVFDSINIVVKKMMDVPSQFNFSEDGVLSWGAVSTFFPGQDTAVTATRYRVRGEIVVYDKDEPTEVIERTAIDEITEDTHWVFEQSGVYRITITALGFGRFDDSDPSVVFEKAFGAMEKISTENFAWDNGVLSWVDDVNEDAKYRVVIDGVQIGQPQEETEIDLTEYFNALDAKRHKIQLVVMDKNGELISQICDTIYVTKLEAPEVSYDFSTSNGGCLVAGYVQNATAIKVVASKSGVDTIYSLANVQDGTTTILAGLDEGVYDVRAYAVADSGWYYRSDACEFGKIYKLAQVEFSGYEQDFNDTQLTFNGTLASEVNTKVKMFIGQRVNTFDGVVGENKGISLEITLSTEGRYEITTIQMPATEENEIDETSVYVINSDTSEMFDVYKLAPVTAVSHDYEANVSVLTFDKITNATAYRLQVLDGEYVDVDETLYEVSVGASEVQITFTDRLENDILASSGGEISLKVIAGQDENVPTIESSYDFTLTKLGTAAAVARENTNKTLSWTAVSNAAGYRLEIYEITKTFYTAGSTNIDVSALTKVDETTATNSYTFADVGYYLVKVFAVSESGSLYLSAATSFDSLVCVAEQIELANVKFGYDDTNEKYYVVADNVENLDGFEILIDDTTAVSENKSSGLTSKYLLLNQFVGVDGAEQDFEVKVIGKANDSMIYLDSEEWVFEITRLPKVEYRNMIVGDWEIVSNGNFGLTEVSQNLRVNAITGARGIKIWDVNNQSNVAGGENAASATYILDSTSNVTLAFKYFGNAKTGELFNDNDGEIYLDGPTDSIIFTRLANLTDLRYQSGNLVFENAQSASTSSYVLTTICKDANSDITNIKIKLEPLKVTATANGQTAVLATSGYYTNSGSTITIDLDGVLTLLENAENDTIRQTYEQGTKFGFVVYSNPRSDLTGSLSSFIGRLEEDSSKNVVVVERMEEPDLDYEISGSNIILSWDPVSTRVAVSSATEYQIYLNGVEYGEKVAYNVTSKQYALADFNLATYYSFVVRAENPYYIGSNDSNIVKIYRLNSLQSLKLISDGDNDGKLEYQVLASEQDFVNYVSVNGVQNNTGKITIGASGSIALQVVGQKNVPNGNMLTSYLDSATTSWTLTNMSTLKPADETISYSNGVISWNAFGAGVGLGTLEYVLMFSDGENVAVFTTTSTSVDVNSNESLYETISGLNEGNLTIKLYAHLRTYSVAAGGTIYYANAIALANGQTKSNYYAYDDTLAIKKLTTPVFESVAFDYNNVLADAQFPDINVDFTGNYDNTAQFGIYINSQRIKTQSITKASNKYSFTLVKNDYNNHVAAGETFKLRVVALSDTDIPSSFGEVQITRVPQAESVSFAEGETGENQVLVIEYDEDDGVMTAGGLVAKIVYTENGGSEQTEYIAIPVGTTADEIRYDLSSFIETNLSSGGEIQVSVFANNYAAGGVYYLACPTYEASAEFDVLNSVSQANITISAGGFEIDKLVNSEQTKYILKCLDKTYEVEYEDSKFFFELDDAWGNDTYQIEVYAVEDDYVRSATATISITLNRINSISGVSIERDPVSLSSVTMSWDAVSNANGYIVKLYRKEANGSAGRLLYRTEVLTNSNTIAEIFGENYSRVFAYGEIAVIPSDLDVKIGITTIGTSGSENNSREYLFDAKINGRVIVVGNIDVDSHGLVSVDATEGERYLYRFVSNLGAALSSSTWTEIEVDGGTILIDASFLKTELVSAGTQFNFEIVRMGSDAAESTDVDFVLDSQKFTTFGSEATFAIHSEIESVGYTAGAEDQLLLCLTTGTFDKIFVGTSADAIINGEVEEFEPEYAFGKDSTTAYYGYDLDKFIDLVKDSFDLPDGTNTLYFWSHRAVESREAIYINSPAKPFEFVLENGCGFTRIEKYENAGNEDLANVFAIFEKDDVSGLTTIGILVRITQEATEVGVEDIEEVRFITKDVLSNQDYYGSSAFAINLTDIFEEEELVDGVGTFVVDFARVQIDETNNQYHISQWLSQETGAEKEFTRLQGVTNISLLNGMLSWVKSDELADKFYIYFAGDVGAANELMGDYRLCVTENNFFYANDEVGENVEFYLAVRAVSEDPLILSSKLVFIMDDDSKVAKIYKNKVSDPLIVEDGNMYFDWNAYGDFLTTLNSMGALTGGQINDLVEKTFHFPFSFSIKELVSEKVKLRFRFTDLERQGAIAESYDVDAINLLTNLFADNSGVEEQFEAFAARADLGATKSIIRNFIDKMKSRGWGIGNEKILFDKIFERLQAGKYKLEYCVLGNDTTLTSKWYQYENNNGDNIVYVSEQPMVRATKEETASDSVNHYKLIIKKSEIFDETYAGRKADNYVIVLRNEVGGILKFTLTKGIDSYSLALDGSSAASVSVYETNEAGVVTANGDYLMFYLNHNSGDSVLGRYESEIVKGKYEMQVYAVGTDCAFSSKSEYFTLMFYGMGENLQMVNGKFTWSVQANADTTIVYKKLTSLTEEKRVIYGEKNKGAELDFELEDTGSGEFEYIEFVTVGMVEGNRIYVDSEIYRINDVYKLAAPTLSNNAGYITIKENNKEIIDQSYSDSASPLYTYKIYNNVSTETTYVTRTDENEAATNFLYEAGTTFVKDNDEQLRKANENEAQKFYVKSLGTTAQFEFVREMGDEYYIKTMYCIDDSTSTRTNKNVVVSSRYQEFNAEMIATPQSARIRNGKLLWNAVTGKGEKIISSRHKIVYKLTIEQYNYTVTNGVGDVAKTSAGETRYFYTTQTEFDFANITDEEAKYYSVTIQALAMQVDKREPSSVSPDSVITLMGDEGFAFGNIAYFNSSSYVLMSEGAKVDDIERTKSIENLCTEDGHLAWEFVSEDEEIPANYDLFASYTFFVQDEKKNEIAGTFAFTELNHDEKRFKVTFVENKGEIKAGLQTLSVFATKNTSGKIIKSYGVDIVITKMPEVKVSDIEINSTNDPEVEEFTLGDYFTGKPGVVVISSPIGGSPVVFTPETNLLYILSAEKTIDLTNAAGKAVVTNNSLTINLQTRPSSVTANVLYSDVSDNIILQRAAWERSEGDFIWDETDQKFVWDYNGDYALQESLWANVVRFKVTEEISEDADIFEDDALTTPSEVELGNDYEIVGVYDTFVQIKIDGVDYFVSIEDYSTETSENELEVVAPIAKDAVVYENSTLTQIATGISPVGAAIVLVSDTYVQISVSGHTYYVSIDDYCGELLHTGTLYEVVESMGDDRVIKVKDTTKMYLIAKEKVVGPTYIVSITQAGETRIYTTQNEYFTPTIIGGIANFSIRIKLGPTNIQSQAFEYVGFAAFNLFNSGRGTMLNPYEITTEAEILNIAKRMKKMNAGEHLNQYVMGGQEYIEEEKFYFVLSNDITVSESFEGILFAGDFNGEIDGNGFTITYTASSVQRLSSSVNIAGGYVTNNAVQFQYGSALFEHFEASAKVLNLNINVSFEKTGNATISNHSLIAGLVIINNGQIDNVCVTSFESDFVGQYAGAMVDMLYSGLVAVNIGESARVTNCGNTADMVISNYGEGQVDAVAGFVTLNYSTINNCTCGTADSQNTIKVDGSGSSVDAYVSGIATINMDNATIRDCTNYADVTVHAENGDNWHAYLDEICVRNNGTMQDNASPNYVAKTAVGLGVNTLSQGPNYSA